MDRRVPVPLAWGFKIYIFLNSKANIGKVGITNHAVYVCVCVSKVFFIGML